MFREIKGKKKLNALYKAQEGICHICDGDITAVKGYRIHEATGNDYIITKILEDANCYRKLHYLKEVVEL